MEKVDEILKFCKLWDSFIGFNFTESNDIVALKLELEKLLNGHEIIDPRHISHWNRMILFYKIDKKRTENMETALINKAIKYGKTEQFYLTYNKKMDLSSFENLIKNCCKELGLQNDA